MNNPRGRWMAAGLSAAVCVGCLAALFGGGREAGYRFLWVAAFAALTALGGRCLALPDRRERRCFMALGALMAGAQALGLRLGVSGYTGVVGLFMCLGAGAGAGPAAGCVLAAAWRGLRALPVGAGNGRRSAGRVMWGSAALIFICWLPVLLAYWPGISAYDIYTQLDEVFSGQYTNRNPLLHTLILGAFYRLGEGMGNPAWGYALFILMQMAFMAAAFGAAMGHLWRIGAPRAIFWTALALFALFPVHAMLAVSDTKDGYFVALLVLLLIRFHRLLEDPSLLRRPGFVAGFAALGALMCMMRNNAFAGILAALAAGLVALGKEGRLRLCALMLGTLALYQGVLGGLKAAFDASGTLATELVSVQSQQMGRVYTFYHESEPDDCHEIATWLPTVEDYTPYTADPLKTFAIVDKPERMWGFLKLWGRVGLRHPVTYLTHGCSTPAATGTWTTRPMPASTGRGRTRIWATCSAGRRRGSGWPRTGACRRCARCMSACSRPMSTSGSPCCRCCLRRRCGCGWRRLWAWARHPAATAARWRWRRCRQDAFCRLCWARAC